MQLQAAIKSFSQNYLKPKGYSSRTLREYQNELAKFEQFCRRQTNDLSNPENLIEALDHYLHERTADLSQKQQHKIISRFRSFFKYLHQKGIIPQNLGSILPHLSWAKNGSSKTELLQHLRQLEQMLYDLKRIGTIRKRFSSIKREVVKVGKHNLPLQELLMKAGMDEVVQMKAPVKAELDKQIDELFWVGSVILNGDIERLSNELSTLTKNVSRLGREQFKANALDEAKQESNNRFFEQLLTRLGNTEKFLEDLTRFKKETEDKIDLNFVKELLPAIDGLEEALASIPEFTPLQPQTSLTSKGFLRQLFSGTEKQGESKLLNPDQWFQGLKIIHNRLLAVLRKRNISPIKSIGEKFDPRRHIAVGVEYRIDKEENIIIEEQLKGYCRGDEVIRYAEVVVSKRPNDESK